MTNMQRKALEEKRHCILNGTGGYETPESLQYLREMGWTAGEVRDRVYGYGPERWRLVRLAGFTLDEIVDVMRNGWWTYGADEIQDLYLPEHLQNQWTRLFFYCGFEIAELKKVGFTSVIPPEKQKKMQEERARMTWRFSKMS
jgi:hypothetical protein